MKTFAADRRIQRNIINFESITFPSSNWSLEIQPPTDRGWRGGTGKKKRRGDGRTDVTSPSTLQCSSSHIYSTPYSSVLSTLNPLPRSTLSVSFWIQSIPSVFQIVRFLLLRIDWMEWGDVITTEKTTKILIIRNSIPLRTCLRIKCKPTKTKTMKIIKTNLIRTTMT